MCAKYSFIRTCIYTLTSSGNIYQAGLSYGSNQAVKKITGKSPTENIKSLCRQIKRLKVEEKEKQGEFFALVKSRIEKTSKIIQLANQ